MAGNTQATAPQETQATSKLNVALAAEFSIFRTDLSAMFLKEQNGIRFLVIPTNAEEPPMISLEQLIEDVKKMAGKDTDTSAIESAVSNVAQDSGKGIDLANIKFQLKMLYFYLDTTQGEGKKIVEYAININIVTEGLVPAAIKDFVDVKHIGIAVWNTDRQQILHKMSIADIDQYLGIGTKTPEETQTETETAQA